MRFEDKLAAAQRRNRSWLCVGLDIVAGKLPLSVQQTDDPLLTFARAIVDATQDLVCAFKPNLGFFLAEGAAGIIALERLARYFPRDFGLPLAATGSAPNMYLQSDIPAGLGFRSCSYSLLFRPAGLLATLVAPTVHSSAQQLWLLRPSTPRFVASSCPGYASRPNRAIDGRGLSPH